MEIVVAASVAIGGWLEFARRVNDPVPMQANPHRTGGPLLLEVARERTGDPLLHRDAVLRDAERAGDLLLGGDAVRDRATDPGRGIAIEPAAIGGAAGIPGPLTKVGFPEVVQQCVRAEPLESAVAQLVGPHTRHQVAEILDELAILAGFDPAGSEQLASDDGRRL
jgi:hypothetical protein